MISEGLKINSTLTKLYLTASRFENGDEMPRKNDIKDRSNKK